MIEKIKIQDLRFWSNNPRFTSAKYYEKDISIIGSEDFKKGKDLYFQNLDKYYKKLLPETIKQKNNFYDLVEDISVNGFISEEDDFIVTPPKTKTPNISNKPIFYVLEGNRRLFAFHLLLNFKNSRKILQQNIDNKIYKKFQKLFENSKINQNTIIECKNFQEMEDKKILRILNSRHFGHRKGKLNWPRGLSLEKISLIVENFRSSHKIKQYEKLSKEKYQNLLIKIENETRKKINDLELKNILWSMNIINLYNNHPENKNNKILLSKTEDEISSKENDEENEASETKNSSNNNSNFFNISSLELSYSKMTLNDEKGNPIKLSKKINLNLDTKRWKINHSLGEEQWQNLALFIIEKIKSRELNTRKFDRDNCESELISILSNDVKISNKTLKAVQKNKKLFSQLTWHQMQTIPTKNTDFEENEKENKRLKKKFYLPLFTKIDKIGEIIAVLDLRINDFKKNKFIWTFLWLFCKEFKELVIDSKNHIRQTSFPYFFISSILRSTSELLLNLWIINDENIKNKFKDLKTTNNKKNKTNHIKEAISKEEFNKEITDNYCTYCEGKFVLRNTSDLNNIKKDFDKFLNDLKNKNNSINNFFKKHKNYFLSKSNYPSFFSWVFSTDYLNKIIHKTHFIYDLCFEKDLFLIKEELDLKLTIIIKLLELLKDYIYFLDKKS